MAEKIKLGKLEIDLNELANFLVLAKKSCYAGSGAEIRLEDGSKFLQFKKGDFYYSDNYAGWYQAPGEEIVRWKDSMGQRIWQMSYSGGMNPEFFGNEILTRETFAFLKEMLNKVEVDLPFRGPGGSLFKGNIRRAINGEGELWEYSNNFTGNIKRFKGTEKIRKINGKIFDLFSQDYLGGLVISRE